jgi:folate-dependent phosphoribosylglycinamide formyltransferase PurN
MMANKRVGIMISGSGTNMQAIVRACEVGHVDADVVFVGADNLDASGLIWADEMSIPIFDIDYNQNEKGLRDPYFDELVKDVYRKSTFLHPWFAGGIQIVSRLHTTFCTRQIEIRNC